MHIYIVTNNLKCFLWGIWAIRVANKKLIVERFVREGLHQLQSFVADEDLRGLIRDAAEDREAVPTCSVDEANSARDTLVTAVVLSDVSHFGNGERRADDGESGTRLDISITRL